MTNKLLRRGIYPILAAVAVAVAAAAVAAAPMTAALAQTGGDQPALLGQFGDWGAYKATPGGKPVCFAISKPTTAVTDPPGRNRDAAYLFVSTRPAEKVKNEISTVVGYPQKPSANTTATIGSQNYAMYPQNDGAWIRNAAEEAQMINAMRAGADLVIRSESSRGTKTIDTYSLKGISEALDKVAEECK